MSQKTWGGRFSGATDDRVEAFTESVSLDRRLYRHDVRASQAHARMLAEVGLPYLEVAGPVLTRVATDYGPRPIRWIDAAKARFTKELTAQQKARFLARLGSRALDHHPQND